MPTPSAPRIWAIALLSTLAFTPLAAADDPPSRPTQSTQKAEDWTKQPLYESSATLVHWWPLDGHAYDFIGQTHGDVQNGATYSRGGLVFPNGGGADHRLVGMATAAKYDPALTESFTICLWVYPTNKRRINSTSQAYAGRAGTNRLAWRPEPISRPRRGQSKAGCAGLSVGTNGVTVLVSANGQYVPLLACNVSIRKWTHLAVAFRDNTPTLYINGRFARKGAASAVTVHPSYMFGGHDRSSHYAGYIDDPMVFKRALTAKQVQAVAATSAAAPAIARPKTLTQQQYEQLWQYLGGEPAPGALFAMHRLAQAGDAAARWVGKQLLTPGARGDSVEQLIEKLDDDEYAVRQWATKTLIRKGDIIRPRVRATLTKPVSAEARWRLKKVLEHVGEPGMAPARMRRLRAIAVLGRIPTPFSRRTLATLANGPRDDAEARMAKAMLARLGQAR